MRKIFLIAAATGLGLTSLSLIGVAANAGSPGAPLALAMNGAAGKAGISRLLLPVKVDSKLYDYCAKVIDDVKRGKSAKSSSSFAASDCIEIFVNASIPGGMTAAQSGQAGRGGDGGGLPGLPGGKGGAAGGSPGASGGGGSASAKADVDDELLDYCSALLKQSRPGSSAKKPVESDDYEASDCVDYFASLDTSGGKGASEGTGSAARPGADGASISGGQGGEGGKKGGGPGGASGGAGGVGVGGGSGGKGGAGGGGY